jgi:ATF/CREB family transcription factor
LQSKVEFFGSENESLLAQISQLKQEVTTLKTLLVAHKDCTVTQQQAAGNFISRAAPVEAYPPQMAYSMAAPLANHQAVLAGQARRFS